MEADDGYIREDLQCIKCPAGFANPTITEDMQQRVRESAGVSQQTFKNWGILKQVFHHEQKLSVHGDMSRAVAIITQLAIQSG